MSIETSWPIRGNVVEARSPMGQDLPEYFGDSLARAGGHGANAFDYTGPRDDLGRERSRDSMLSRCVVYAFRVEAEPRRESAYRWCG